MLVEKDLEQWLEQVRALPPGSQTVGEMAELEEETEALLRRLDNLDGYGAGLTWFKAHEEEILRPLIRPKKPVDT